VAILDQDFITLNGAPDPPKYGVPPTGEILFKHHAMPQTGLNGGA